MTSVCRLARAGLQSNFDPSWPDACQARRTDSGHCEFKMSGDGRSLLTSSPVFRGRNEVGGRARKRRMSAFCGASSSCSSCRERATLARDEARQPSREKTDIDRGGSRRNSEPPIDPHLSPPPRQLGEENKIPVVAGSAPHALPPSHHEVPRRRTATVEREHEKSVARFSHHPGISRRAATHSTVFQITDSLLPLAPLTCADACLDALVDRVRRLDSASLST
jgi:hypothetical protein